jgi:DNA-binding NarL/FixJ family response regulator
MRTISILFGRTAELWWDGLARLLGEMDQFQVAGICSSGLEVIQKASALKPDIILLDEEMSGGDCVEVAQNMNKISPETNIVIITKPYKNIDVNSIFKTKAKAYIDKDISLVELVRAIENVVRGDMVVISPLVASKMLQYLDQSAGQKSIVRYEFDINLSNRETEILSLLANKGTTNRQIADLLVISENTVKTHLASIIRKMNVSNRQQAAAKAREIGIVPVVKVTSNSILK